MCDFCCTPSSAVRDSSVLSPTGLLDGNFWQLGNYDECVGMYITKPDFRIIGRYCLPELTFRPTKEYYPGYYRPDHSMDYFEQDADANAYDFFRVSEITDFLILQWVVGYLYQSNLSHFVDIK